MKKIKMFFVLLSVFALWILSVGATYNSSANNWYNAAIFDWSIKFNAELRDWKVYASWTKYNKNEGFKYYKVIKSQKVLSPIYPDNWYIKYSSDINYLSYVDEKVKSGINYYRVCAITKEKNRYCSNVVKIVNEKELRVWGDRDSHGCYSSAGYTWCGVKNKCIRTWEEKCEVSQISESKKMKLDKLVSKFVKKIEDKYGTNEKRVRILKIVVQKLNKLAVKRPKIKYIIDYINTKLKEKVFEFESDIESVENIFNEY